MVETKAAHTYTPPDDGYIEHSSARLAAMQSEMRDTTSHPYKIVTGPPHVKAIAKAVLNPKGAAMIEKLRPKIVIIPRLRLSSALYPIEANLASAPAAEEIECVLVVCLSALIGASEDEGSKRVVGREVVSKVHNPGVRLEIRYATQSFEMARI